MEKDTLALEMLKELKVNARRWFIIAVVELILLIGSNVGWWIYESSFETVSGIETTTVDAGTDGIATYLENSESGDISYGEDSKN